MRKQSWINHQPILISRLFLVIIFLFASQILFAQAAIQTNWSRGEQVINTGYDEAMRRAEAALKAEGYSISKVFDGCVAAHKSIHTALIMCNQAPGDKMWVNVVVTSMTNDGGGVPGLERERLQRRMGEPGSNPPAGNTSTQKWNLTAVVPPDQPYSGTYTITISFTNNNGNLTGTGQWSNGPSSTFTGTIKNGEINFTRVDQSGFKGNFWGRVVSDVQWEGSGKNDPNSYGGNSGNYTWKAMRVQ